MVLNPFSALGLASNVVQFVDFGYKLVSGAVELYQANNGTSAANAELELIIEDLSEISAGLGPGRLLQASGLRKNEPKLQDLADSCKELADEFLSVLESLKVQGRHKRWKSALQATRSAWKEKQIRSYMKRLDEFRSQLTVRLVATLSNQQSTVLRGLNELSEHHRRLEISSINEPARLRKELLSSIEKSSKDMRQIQKTLSALISEGGKLATELRILESLRFQSMKARHSRIVEAYAKTFEWIFKTSFIEWLESHSGIYWVRGKAGSGKSTLMKFLWGHERTIQGLGAWAGQKKLVTASYFFWNPGTDMQKSQEGLLQSLLYSILRQCPAMIPLLCPSRWQKDLHQVHNDPWTRSELWLAFLQLKKHSIESVRFCFFIDGLDEYEGNHAEIVAIMEDLAALSDIKVCLSSRPWNVFEDAFGTNTERKLSLHEYTKEDINLYIRNNLEEDDRFAKLITKDDRYQELVTEIMNKAHGVFLWVFLVVRSLLRGLSNSDTIFDLQKRLTLLPTDLERYFRHMLDSTENVYHEQAAQIFQICLATVEPLSLMTLSYFEEEDPDYAFRMTIQPLDETHIEPRCRQLQKRVKARCNDLLEITNEKSSDAIFFIQGRFLAQNCEGLSSD